MSAIMKGGKNSLSIYRAKILILFVCRTDAQSVLQQLTDSGRRSFNRLIHAKKSYYPLVASYR